MKRSPRSLELGLARVLLVGDNPATRLTLKTVLEAGGYAVDAAASAAEASGKLEDGEYQLVLSDLQMEPDAGKRVIAEAKSMKYRPATARVRSYSTDSFEMHSTVLITPEDIPELLGQVAELIAERAERRIERERLNRRREDFVVTEERRFAVATA